MIGLSFTLRVGMPMFSRLFALMNDQNRFGFVSTLLALLVALTEEITYALDDNKVSVKLVFH